MYIKNFFIFFFIILFGNLGFADQKESKNLLDSIITLTYDKIEEGYYNNEYAFDKGKLFADAYLLKAKKENDTLRICIGYHFLAYHYYNDLSLVYSDSIIRLSKHKKYDKYPISAYLLSGDLYFNKKKFKEAFRNYIKAQKYTSNEDEKINYYINHQIGGIKAKLLLNEEALKIFRESWIYVNKNNYKKNNKSEYLQALTDLAIQYVRNNKLDSATVLNKEGIKQSLLQKDTLKYNILVLNEGINLFLQKHYKQSNDSILKTITYLEKINNFECLSFVNYYLGRIQEINGNKDESIAYFQKNDSIYQITKDLHPILVDGYESIVSYYKSNNKKEKALTYAEKLLKVNKLIEDNYRSLSTKIIKEYDTPKLIDEKEKIIESVQEDKSIFRTSFLIFLITTIFLFILWIYYYKKQIRYKNRFENLLNKNFNNSPESHNKNTLDKVSKTNKFDNKDLGLSEEVKNMILEGLKEFEKNKRYIENNLTLTSLSKEMNTNPRYLSLIINHLFEKNFASYINSLRINYSIEKLKSEKKFRNYTIKAIANDCGFNSSESFSSAFYKETGLRPSYFIKKLENIS